MKSLSLRGRIGSSKLVWFVSAIVIGLNSAESSRAQFVLQPGATGQIQMYVENMGPPQPGAPDFDALVGAVVPPPGTGKLITPGSGYKAYNPDTVTPNPLGTALNTFIGGVSGPLPSPPFVQFLVLTTPGVFAYGHFAQTVNNNGVFFFSNGLVDRNGTAVNTGGVFGPNGAASEIFGGSTAMWQYTGPAGAVGVGVGLALNNGFLVNPAAGDQAAAGVLGVFTRFDATGAFISQNSAYGILAAGDGQVGGLIDGGEDHFSDGLFDFGAGVFTATGPNTFSGWTVSGYSQLLNPGDYLRLDLGVTLVADPDASFSLTELPTEAPTFFGANVDMTVVPEPGSGLLVVIGVLLLGAGGWKSARSLWTSKW